jgi:hypothetical protein
MSIFDPAQKCSQPHIVAKALGHAKKAGNGFVCSCPCHDDQHASLSLSESADGKLLFYCHVGCSQEILAEEFRRRGWLGANHGESARGRQASKDEASKWMHTVPPGAPRAPSKHYQYREPAQVWVYRGKDGHESFYDCRFNLADGEKEFRPLTLWRHEDGRLKWRWKAPPAPRILYNLDQIVARPAAPVVLCEGSKCADTASKIFPEAVCIASLNGAKSAKQNDWSPLAGRTVIE